MGRHGGRRAAGSGSRKRVRSLGGITPVRAALGVGALVGGGLVAWGIDQQSADAPSAPVRAVGAPEAGVAKEVPRPAVAREGVPSTTGDDPLRKGGDADITRGNGEFSVLPRGTGLEPNPKAMTYTVEIEGGVRVPRKVLADTVDAVLTDARGWRSKGFVLARTDQDPDFRILLASPDTTDKLCYPLDTRGRVSCHNADGDVVLNARRWTQGIPDYAGDLAQYRTYLVNHEVGHHLGHQHQECGGPGQPAPVMMQQTYGLKGCLRNAWPL